MYQLTRLCASLYSTAWSRCATKQHILLDPHRSVSHRAISFHSPTNIGLLRLGMGNDLYEWHKMRWIERVSGENTARMCTLRVEPSIKPSALLHRKSISKWNHNAVLGSWASALLQQHERWLVVNVPCIFLHNLRRNMAKSDLCILKTELCWLQLRIARLRSAT